MSTNRAASQISQATGNSNSTNDRRFPRVYLHTAQNELSKVLGARGGWVGSSELAVCDLSYAGVAFLRASLAHGPLSFADRERMDLVLHLAGEREPVNCGLRFSTALFIRSSDH